MTWARHLLSLMLFALLCAIGAYWAMQLRAPTPAVVPAAAAGMPAPGFDAGLHARLFGGPAGTGAGNVRALGVIAPMRVGAPGIALLAVDDQPARAYATGEALASDTVLRAVHHDRIVIEQGGALNEIAVPQATPGTASSQGVAPPENQPGAAQPANAGQAQIRPRPGAAR